MGLKTECKKYMAPKSSVVVHHAGVEYEGEVEYNSLITGDHGDVEGDSVVVIRNDKNKVRYVIPLGAKMNFVIIIPFKKPKEEM